MRRGNKPEIIFNDECQVLGVNLSSDFCAEHEWGIAKLKTLFGIPDDIAVYGMARRKITTCPETLSWVEFDRTEEDSLTVGPNKSDRMKTTKQKYHYEGFFFRPWVWGNNTPSALAKENSELRIYRPWKRIIGDAPTPTTAAAWSEDDFAFVSCDEEEQKALKIIFSNFEKLNIVIMFSGKNTPFENPGLVIAIADRIPPEYVTAWEVHDKDWHAVKTEFAATGIEELLKKANKRYFALSPRRQDDGSLKYWLNPYEQKENNFGWYTLEDLKLWAVDEGPIPIKSKKEAVH